LPTAITIPVPLKGLYGSITFSKNMVFSTMQMPPEIAVTARIIRRGITNLIHYQGHVEYI